MLSYTNLRTQYGLLTNDTSSENLSLGTTLMNENIRQVCAEKPWPFLEKLKNISTVASQQFYDLPADYLKTTSVTVTISSIKYHPREVSSRKQWDYITSSTYAGDIPQFFFIFNGQIGFYPTPATSVSNAIGFVYRRNVPDLNLADYTTGTVTAVNGDETITGAGTTFTSPMIGRYLRITGTDTAASSGDHFWYEIDSVTSATALELVKPYAGLGTVGAAYTIGQMPVLPEAFHMLPVLSACQIYFSTKNVDNGRAKQFQDKYDAMFEKLCDSYGSKTDSVVVLDDDISVENPNLYPTSLS